MKSDIYGTPSEQLRASRGWRSPTQRKAEGWSITETCVLCRHSQPRGTGRWLCSDSRLATLGGATCRHWEGRS